MLPSNKRPSYNGQLEYWEFKYEGHQVGLRLPKEVWDHIKQVGEKDFLDCQDEGEFFDMLYPGWMGYIRHQLEVQHSFLVFQNSVFSPGVLAARGRKENVPGESGYLWGG